MRTTCRPPRWQILAAVEFVRNRRSRDVADARVPERRAGGRIERDEVASNVAREDQVACSREHTAGSTDSGGRWQQSPPADLARAVVDGREIARRRADRRDSFSAEAHRPAWI